MRGRSCNGARHVASLGAEALELTGHFALWRSSAHPTAQLRGALLEAALPIDLGLGRMDANCPDQDAH